MIFSGADIRPGASRDLVASLGAADLWRPLPLIGDGGERPITADQTNVSVVVGESLVVKWFTPPVPPPHRALSLLRHLAAVGFADVPPVYAAVFDGSGLRAVVDGFLPEAVDGWEWCVDAAVSGAAIGGGLGELTARLHLALATASEVIPEPVTWADGVGWHARAEAAVAGALAEVGNAWIDQGEPFGILGAEAVAGEAATGAQVVAGRGAGGQAGPVDRLDSQGAAAADAGWLAAVADRLRETIAPLDAGRPDRRDSLPSFLGRLQDVTSAGQPRVTGGTRLAGGTRRTPVLRIHGDLHVGQVLRWRDGYAVIDFDGNPTVGGDTPQPLARDVAQMLTSVAHVGRIAIRRRGAGEVEIAAWTRRNCDDFLTAYVAGLGDRGDLFDATLVGPFAVEQECRELIYAARYRPTWRYAAMGVLRAWFGEGGTA